MQVVVDSLLTSYNKIGDGSKTALFLHGWADSGKTFTALATEFIAENPAYTAVLLDLPGFGATQTPAGAWGLPDYATFVAHFLDKTNLQADLLVGHSNGGAIAIHGLSQGILRTDQLVLVASAGVRTKTAKKDAMRIAAKPAKALLKLAPKATQCTVKQKMYGAIGSDYLVAEHMQETFKKVVAYDVTDEARSITIPVCLVYGEDDTATPPAYGRLFSEVIAGSRLSIIPLSGHFVHQEQSNKVASLITDFVKGGK